MKVFLEKCKIEEPAVSEPEGVKENAQCIYPALKHF